MIAALESGVAVFCQKPLGRNARETRGVIAAARQANKLLGVDLSYRFLAGMTKIRQLISRGELGKVYAIEMVFHNAYGPDKPWFYNSKLSGGGCVIDLGIHLVDLALWALDFPRVLNVTSRLFAGGEPLRGQKSVVEDYASARLDLETGATVQLSCSWKLPAGRDALIQAFFYGTRGGAGLRNVNGSFYDFIAQRFHGTALELLAAPPASWNIYRLSVTRGLEAADLVVAPSFAMLSALRSHYGPLPSSEVIPNGRDAEMFHPGKKEKCVLSAGRLWDEAKNVAALAEIAPQLPWPVYVAGDEKHPENGMVHPKNVVRLGRLALDELAPWYGRAAIYALPARYEPFGLSALEAGLAGCALVLGDIPSLREIWGDAAVFVPHAGFPSDS